MYPERNNLKIFNKQEVLIYISFQLLLIIFVLLEWFIPILFIIAIITLYFFIVKEKSFIYFIIISLFTGHIILSEPISIKIIDILILLGFLIFIFRVIKYKQILFSKTHMDIYFLILAISLLISLIDVGSFNQSLINYFRHIQLFLVYFMFIEIT